MSLEILTTCPLCGSGSLTKFIHSKDYTLSGEVFNIDRCGACGFTFTNPRPTEASLGKYYQTEKYISHSDKSTSLFDKIYFIARNYNLNHKLNLINQFKKSGRVLDYGCGTGAFLKHLQNNRWDSHGIEPSENARSIAQQDGKILVHHSISELPLVQFDVITLWHVMEHITDFVNKAKDLRGFLNKDGIMLIAVPNHESPDAEKYRSAWAGYDVPRHISHFSKTSMKLLLDKTALELLAILPLKLDAYYVSLLSETYLHPRQNKLISGLLALYAGFTSNQKARKNTNYSSLIYVVRAK